MLFTIGLLLLVTPFPSFQATTSLKRDSESDVSKADAVFTLSKPKPTAALSKQTVRSTPKPNAVSLTVLSAPAINQKPSAVNATLTAKSKLSPAVIQTTPSPAVKATTSSGSTTIKDKPTGPVNRTAETKPLSASDVKNSKDKPASSRVQTPLSTPAKADKAISAADKDKLTVSANQTTVTSKAQSSSSKTMKSKLHPLANQTVLAKSPLGTDVRDSKDKPAPTGALGGQTTSTKTTSVGVAKSSKDPVQPLTNETVSRKSPSASDGKGSKDKPVPTGAPDVKPTSTQSASKPIKDKPQPSTNETVSAKLPSASDGKGSKDKPVPTGAPDVKPTSTQSASKPIKDKPQPSTNETVSGKSPSASDGKGSKDKPVPTGEVSQEKPNKNKSAASVNQPDVENSENAPGLSTPSKASANRTTVVKPPTTTKEKSPPSQPIKVVINNGCESSNAKQQELELQPGAPLVMTHKISLLPSGCTGECESEMAALTQRVARLEREMSLLKEKCPCSGNCPDDCSGNGKCEKGKCICHQGFMGPDCTAKRKTEEKAETTTEQVINNKEGLELKDEPHTNNTQSNNRSPKNTTKTVPGTTRTGKEMNVTQSPDKGATTNDNKNTDTGKKSVQMGGSGLGSVKVVNVSSHSFTLAWLAPQRMFKNFTVIRTEPRLEGDDNEFREEGHQTSRAKNSTEVRVRTEGTRTPVSRGKADTKRISIVVPGSVRSVEFSNLRANTRYALQIYGTGAEKRSRIHRVTAVTGPESATDIVFSNVTESSLTVSWSKPKSTYTGFRVTYTNAVTGERHSVTVGSRQSHAVLSKLSAGSTYTVSVTATLGRAQSDALTSVMTTVPAPPAQLQVVNVTDNRAVLHWTPSLGKVDRFVITYESSKTPNVTVAVTVTVPGSSADHQLRGLQRGTVYTVRVLSQKGSLQSTAVSTTFTTAHVVKAREVGPRSAVITWKTPPVVYHSYRVTYQVAGEEKKEVILQPSITEYKLTGLLPMSRYAVLVQGETEGHYTSLVTTDFTTGKLRFPFPTECSQELLNGALQSGEVDIYPQGKEGQAARVYCDMETDGGGWTVFQRRMNGKTDFYRNWSDYRAGFGNLSEDFWLGNNLLHNLTSVGPVSLRVDMRSGNDTAYAHYTNFSIDSEKRHYALTVSGYTGTAGDSMKYHNGRPFSTWDKDPRSLGIHCAKAYAGGWWYKNCYKTNLNGRYGTNSNNQGIVWIDWKGKDFSIPFTEMKFRPSAFSPATHG